VPGLPPPRDVDVPLEVRSVTAMLMPFTPGSSGIPVIVLELEDGREFTLYNVPYEIVRAINKLQSGEFSGSDERETIFDLAVDLRDMLQGLGSSLERVVIDYLDYSTALYTASAYFRFEGLALRRRMVPSHAIFLALLFNKPIYVMSSLVDQQEEFEAGVAGEDEDEEEEEFEE